MRLALAVALASLAIISCGDQPQKPITPKAISGPGAGLIEVFGEPPTPYWLGPPRKGASLFIEGNLPGSGRLIYTNSSGASLVDGGSVPSDAITMKIINRTPDQIKDDLKREAAARRSQRFVKRSLIGPAYAAGNGRMAVIPYDKGRHWIIISAPGADLIDNALGLLQKTGGKG
jgi:hypothetical protein